MANEEDECDSSSLFTVASQPDITSFLHAQAIKITGLNSNITDTDDDEDDDESSISGHLFASLTQNRPIVTKPYLSQSCFASISTSSQKFNTLDDLTELKWLNTFKLKENKQQTFSSINSTNESISKLSNELKTFVNKDSISYGVLIFLALYSQCDDKQLPWSLTMKQIYEYTQQNHPQILNKRGWKNSLKQTLNTIPCFIKTKHETMKSCSIWTIDPYYRPLLTKAYLHSLSLPMNNNSNQISDNHFPPKATVKTKALPRLYERLCAKKIEKKDEVEEESVNSNEDQDCFISGNKRIHSTSASSSLRIKQDNDNNCFLSSLPGSMKRHKHNKISTDNYDDESNLVTLNKGSIIITPCPSMDHMYLEQPKKSTLKSNELSIDEDDECDSSSIMISTRAQTAIHRRKSSPPKKRSSLDLSSRRANTRISRKIIEQDLQLLRQANNNDSVHEKSIITVSQDVLDLSRNE